MKKLYQLNIELPERGYTLYRMAIEKLLEPVTDPWETRTSGLFKNGGFTLEIDILTTPETIDTLKYEIKRETGMEVE